MAPRALSQLAGAGFEALSLRLALARLALPQGPLPDPGPPPPASGLLPSNAVHALFALGLGPWLKGHGQPLHALAQRLPGAPPGKPQRFYEGGRWRHGAPWYAVKPEALFQALGAALQAEAQDGPDAEANAPTLHIALTAPPWATPQPLSAGEGPSTKASGEPTVCLFPQEGWILTRLPLLNHRVRWEATGPALPQTDGLLATLDTLGYGQEAQSLGPWRQGTVDDGAGAEAGGDPTQEWPTLALGPALRPLPLWAGQRLAQALEDAWTCARFLDARPADVAVAGTRHHRLPRYALAERVLGTLGPLPLGRPSLRDRTQRTVTRYLGRLAPEWQAGHGAELYGYDVRRRFGEGA